MIALVVAMKAEARPLIDALGLAQVEERGPFALHRSDDVHLVISGVGVPSAAAASGYLYSRLGMPRVSAWLHVGVCGHGELPVGTPLLADVVEDAANGRRWFPQLVFDPPCATAPYRTVSRVETEFREPMAYDMESAGFVSQALRWSTAELVHVLKVVSDNRQSGTEGLRAEHLSALVKASLDPILAVVEANRKLVAELTSRSIPPTAFEELIATHRLTATQERRATVLLRRMGALAGSALPLSPAVRAAKDGRQALFRLEEEWSALASTDFP